MGSNGAGKSTLISRVLRPVTHLPLINADEIAAAMWPGDEEAHAYEASAEAARLRDGLLEQRASFITETVFSHPSKLSLIAQAKAAGYLVALHVVLLSEDVTVARVSERVGRGGHSVPEHKIRERYARLWRYVLVAVGVVDEATFYDNSVASNPLLVVARYRNGRPVGTPRWPAWTPDVLQR